MKKFLSIMLAVLLMSACAGAYADGEAGENAPAGFALGLRVLAQLDTGTDSTAVSPQSLYLALAMAAQGAHGATRHELAHALGCAEPDAAADSAALAALERAGVKSAQAYFSAADLVVKPDYQALVSDKYNAEGFGMDKDVVQRVNEWADAHTDGLITDVLARPPEEDTKLLLINALLMDAEWRAPFADWLTGEAAFHGANGDSHADIMHMTGEMLYAEHEGVQTVYLPYTTHGLGMYVLLPTEQSAAELLDQMAGQAEAGHLPECLADMRPAQVSLSLPRVGISTGGSMRGALEQCGLSDALNLGADFSGISDSHELYISDVIQSCVLNVTERGTRAAAVTVVCMDAGCAAPDAIRPEPVRMDVNRPYIMLVTLEGECGAAEQLLFAAIVNDIN